MRKEERDNEKKKGKIINWSPGPGAAPIRVGSVSYRAQAISILYILDGKKNLCTRYEYGVY